MSDRVERRKFEKENRQGIKDIIKETGEIKEDRLEAFFVCRPDFNVENVRASERLAEKYKRLMNYPELPPN